MFKFLPSQKASLYRVIEARSFNPTDFAIIASNHRHLGQGEAVALKKTDFYFAVYSVTSEYTLDQFHVSFSPGAQKISDSDRCYDWNTVLRVFADYLEILRRELS